MRMNATPFSRIPRLWGRLVFSTAAFAGSFHLLDSATLSQQPKTGSQVARRSPSPSEGASTREAREAAIQRIPFQQLTADAGARLKTVVGNSSYFRSMPTEVVDCDQEMFTFLVRHPEVIVNIWEVMGVTKVSLQRTGPFQLQGIDGAGTTSKMDLVFGNDSMHIYFATGSYQGSLWARELNGRCVVVLHNRPTTLPSGKQGMIASMDIFMKLDNIGADLVVKTLGPLVGKTADYNFTECASFFSQISQTAEQNPYGVQQLGKKLTKIDPKIRDQFIATSMAIGKKNGNAVVAVAVPDKQPEPANDSLSFPSLSSTQKLPQVELSTRRQTTPTNAPPLDDRVDPPTILLIGKEPTTKP